MTDTQADLLNANNSRYIPLIPTNGSVFAPGQKLIFEIDPSLGYLKGRDAYLTFDVVNNSQDAARWAFPQGAGVSSLIARVDIYSRTTGQLLESLDNYNQWIGTENQYIRDDFTNIQALEGLSHPNYSWTNYYAQGLAQGQNAITRHRVILKPQEVENSMMSPLLADSKTPAYVTRRFVVPLKCGVFRWWDTEKMVPVLNLGGLRIELNLAPVSQVCLRLGATTKFPNDTVIRPEHPWDLVNEGIRLNEIAHGGGAVAQVGTLETASNGYIATVIDSGLAIGNWVWIYSQASADPNYHNGQGFHTQIADLEMDGTPVAGRCLITFNPPLPDPAADINDAYLKVDPSYHNYSVQGCELKIAQTVMPENAKGQLAMATQYEFTSYDVFLDTIPASVNRHQSLIPSVATRGTAIFEVFSDVNNEDNMGRMSYYTGIGPTELKCSNVLYFINNRPFPLRGYDPRNIGEKALTMNELTKALTTISKPPLNLGNTEFGNIMDYSNTWLLARELARGVFVYNLKNAEPELRMVFTGTRDGGNDVGNVRIRHYVFSKKVVDISEKGIMVEI
jgi:hypothetical protein